MFCKFCGAELKPRARHCPRCGVRCTPEKVKKLPKKRKERSDGPPNIFLRILFVLCAVILFLTSVNSLLVAALGKSAEAEILSTSFRREIDLDECIWDVSYAFTANGQRYVGTDTLEGTRSSVITFGYQVSYLSCCPEISRLAPIGESPGINGPWELLGRLLAMGIGIFGSYVLLWLAFPKLPFFGIGKKKKT